MSLECENYSNEFKRDLTIKNVESGTFTVSFEEKSGEVEIIVTDSEEDIILDVDENSGLSGEPFEVNVPSGNGTYNVIINVKNFTGKCSVDWKIEEAKEMKELYGEIVNVDAKGRTLTFKPVELLENSEDGESYSYLNEDEETFDIGLKCKVTLLDKEGNPVESEEENLQKTFEDCKENMVCRLIIYDNKIEEIEQIF